MVQKNDAFSTPKECVNHYLLYLLPQTPFREKLLGENKKNNYKIASNILRMLNLRS